MVTPRASPPAAALAAPAWRQFQFFSQLPVKDHHSPSSGAPEVLRQPPLISTLASSPSNDLVLLADLDGGISVLSADYEVIRSWQAYGSVAAAGQDGRCTHIVIAEGKWTGVVLTLGEDPSSPYPILRIWDLGRTPTRPSSTPPTLLRESKIQLTRPHPISAFALSPSLSHIVMGLADGTVVAFRHLDQLLESAVPASGPVQGLGKLRVLHEGKDPVTGLGFRETKGRKPSETLFILTTSHVLAYPLSGAKGAVATVIDDIGAGVGCSAMVETREGARMVVARDEAVYVYGGEGREGCYAYEGTKSSIKALSSAISSPSSSTARSTYIAIVSPPLLATASSTSATIRNYARNLPGTPSGVPGSDVAKVTIFDLENKFVAHSGTFEEGVREVWEAWGSVWVLSEGGKLWRLSEQPLASSLSTLFSRNLYTLAVSLAQSRNLPPSEVAEIYRRYGDHLYGKGDYEGAMGCYLKTVGTVQASYVIRKFLDAQRLSHLTSYLQELHARSLANSDHTTLLLNCYTKLADDSSLSSFIHSSSSSSTNKLLPPGTAAPAADEPPFDLETAIRVCRQAGYFDHAVWLAKRYGEHQEYLRIQIEDVGDVADSLCYLRTLGAHVAEDDLLRYGKTLLAAEPKETTKLLIDLCCGTLERIEEEKQVENGKKGSTNDKEKGYMSYLGYAIPSTNGPPSTAPSESTTPATESAPPIPRSAVANLRAGALSNSPASNRKSGIYSSYQVPESIPPSTVAEDLPSPRQFFAHYVDHPHEFITFLETVAARRYGKTLEASPAVNADAPLADPQPLRALELDDADVREEQAIWNALLELYLSHWSSSDDSSAKHEKATLQAKALKLLRSRERIPYDETQALLVCTTAGFEAGFVLLYEQLGMYDDIVRYWIDASSEPSSTGADSAKVIEALKRYGGARPYLYRLVLRYLTTSSELLSRHQADIVDILDEIERERIMPPIAVVQILSTNGTASIGLVREYLKRQLTAEKAEIDSDQGLLKSYRAESDKKQKEILELADPNVPRVFQVTRCSACGGQLDLPSVHFMCRHSYHQRCLAENETQCPNCARTHGVIREIRKNNEQFASRHDLFAAEVEESDEGFITIAGAFGKGVMGFVGEEGA